MPHDPHTFHLQRGEQNRTRIIGLNNFEEDRSPRIPERSQLPHDRDAINTGVRTRRVVSVILSVCGSYLTGLPIRCGRKLPGWVCGAEVITVAVPVGWDQRDERH